MKRFTSYLTAITLLTLGAFAVRAFPLDAQPLWRDEVDALRFATVPWAEMFSSFTRHGWNGPFYFVLLWGWVALAGRSAYAMRFFSLILGVLCVPLIYALGRRLFNRRVGLIAALLVTVSPYLAWYAQEVKMYTLLPALAMLAIYGLRRAVEGHGWHWWVVQIVATSIAFYSHILAALLIPVQVLIALAWWPQVRRRWVGALVSLACLTLPYLPLAAWQIPLMLDDRVMDFPHQSLDQTMRVLLDNWRAGNLFLLRARETGFAPFTLWAMEETLLNGWSMGIFGAHGWGWPWGMVLMGVLALWGLLEPLVPLPRLPGKRAVGERVRGRLVLLCWLVIPLLAVWLVSLRQPIFTDRYLVWSAPAFYLLVASGLAFFLRFEGWGRLVVGCLLGLVLVFGGVNLGRQAVIPVKADFRAATAYVANYQPHNEPVNLPQPLVEADEEHAFRHYLPLVLDGHSAFEYLIVFQIPYGRYSFYYYFPGDQYLWADGLYTNHRAPDGSYVMSEQEASRQMQEMTAGHHVIWLIVTEMEMWDQRGLVKSWLDANTQRTDEAHFTRVDVYRYVK